MHFNCKLPLHYIQSDSESPATAHHTLNTDSIVKSLIPNTFICIYRVERRKKSTLAKMHYVKIK